MKTTKKENASKTKGQTIHTPQPPQDMDPSTHPAAPGKQKEDARAKSISKEDLDKRKLSPREEL